MQAQPQSQTPTHLMIHSHHHLPQGQEERRTALPLPHTLPVMCLLLPHLLVYTCISPLSGLSFKHGVACHACLPAMACGWAVTAYHPHCALFSKTTPLRCVATRIACGRTWLDRMGQITVQPHRLRHRDVDQAAGAARRRRRTHTHAPACSHTYCAPWPLCMRPSPLLL